MQKEVQNGPYGGAPTSHQQLQKSAAAGGGTPMERMAPRSSYMPPRPHQPPAKPMVGPGRIKPAKPTRPAPIGGGFPRPSNQSSILRPEARQMGPRQEHGPRPHLAQATGSANHPGVMAPGPQQQVIQQSQVDRAQQVAVPQQVQHQGLVPRTMAPVPQQPKGAMIPPQQQQGSRINVQMETEAPKQQLSQQNVQYVTRPPLLGQQPQPLQQQGGVHQSPVRPPLSQQQPQPLQQQGGVSQSPVRPPLLGQQPQPLQQQGGVSQSPVRPPLLGQQPQPLQQQGGVSQSPARPPLLGQQPQPFQQQGGVSQSPARPLLLGQQPQPLQQQGGVSQSPARPPLLGQQPQPFQQQGGVSQSPARPLLGQQPQPLQQQGSPQMMQPQGGPFPWMVSSRPMVQQQFPPRPSSSLGQPRVLYGQQVQPGYPRRNSGNVSRASMISAMDQLPGPGPQAQQPGGSNAARRTLQ